MENKESVKYEKQGHVAWVTLNRPEVMNAQNDPLRKAFGEAIEKAGADDDVHVVVVTGAGDKAFSAGADINEFTTMLPSDRIKTRWGVKTHFDLLREIPKPVIAMVNGYAIGGGNEIAIACDMIVASEDAVFGQAEIRIGLIPGAGGTQVLPRLIGEKRAKEMIFTGSTITAQDAYRMGLVNHVVPKEKLRETVDKLVDTLLKQSPIILKAAKIAVNKSLETPLSAGLHYERDLMILCLSTEDQKEGARAFIEKRKPVYKGR